MATDTSTATPSARDRLLAAADELFYAEGIHTVGIDRVIDRAGVAKATLYSAFGNKEGLIRAYLEARLRDRQGRINRALTELATPREKILGVFDVLGRTSAQPGFHGCAFMNASAESPPGSAAEQVSDESRAWTRALFVDLAGEAGAADPEQLGRQLVQLYDGAIICARMDRDSDAAAIAKATAAAIVDARYPLTRAIAATLQGGAPISAAALPRGPKSLSLHVRLVLVLVVTAMVTREE